ncbi:uncharacterized protein TNIN_429411 [Trichonephila inaurata madagascariensis]|uniref:Uncharacterized protein n=1 Tax=Trichonephila inaurata madagascariensis TaxID=2747483 RepID=A0A8X7BSK5_9ARAC|nr:uncharacterized protein TNIN_429411 [Trichonephila inaurata madagascariensis]
MLCFSGWAKLRWVCRGRPRDDGRLRGRRRMGWLSLPLVLCLTVLGQCWAVCRLSEHSCDNGRCIESGRYCDGTDDCGDLSDEPPACTSKYTPFWVR